MRTRGGDLKISQIHRNSRSLEAHWSSGRRCPFFLLHRHEKDWWNGGIFGSWLPPFAPYSQVEPLPTNWQAARTSGYQRRGGPKPLSGREQQEVADPVANIPWPGIWAEDPASWLPRRSAHSRSSNVRGRAQPPGEPLCVSRVSVGWAQSDWLLSNRRGTRQPPPKCR